MTDDLPPWMEFDSDQYIHFEITNRDQALFLIEERDFEAQLIAIKKVLRRNQKADEAVAEEIRELDAEIRNSARPYDEYRMRMEDEWVDAMHDSVFQDAAHSMAAVGMLAPLVESVFVSIFDGLRRRQLEHGDLDSEDIRRTMLEAEFWDPHFVFEKGRRRTDLVQGVSQLAESAGISNHLPDDCSMVLAALFAYRNKMFHHGLEWPPHERTKFSDRIKSDGWPENWFSKSERRDEPWIIYMSPTLVDRCISLIDDVLEGVGQFLSDREADRT